MSTCHTDPSPEIRRLLDLVGIETPTTVAGWVALSHASGDQHRAEFDPDHIASEVYAMLSPFMAFQKEKPKPIRPPVKDRSRELESMIHRLADEFEKEWSKSTVDAQAIVDSLVRRLRLSMERLPSAQEFREATERDVNDRPFDDWKDSICHSICQSTKYGFQEVFSVVDDVSRRIKNTARVEEITRKVLELETVTNDHGYLSFARAFVLGLAGD